MSTNDLRFPPISIPLFFLQTVEGQIAAAPLQGPECDRSDRKAQIGEPKFFNSSFSMTVRPELSERKRIIRCFGNGTAIGFSHSMCTPALAARMVYSACIEFGRA